MSYALSSLVKNMRAKIRQAQPVEEAPQPLNTLIDHAFELCIERIDHIGCKNCGLNGRPTPCDSCSEALAAIDAVKRNLR